MDKITVGGKYNLWTAIKMVKHNSDDIWLCECVCGRRRQISATKLLLYQNHKWGYNGCGYCESVFHKDKPRIIINGKKSPTYGAWCNMIQRCTNPNHASYKYYGGRGITVCKEWRNDYASFYNFVSQLEHYGEKGRSLDRINNDDGYYPGNVRWATAKEQANNKRKRRGKSDEQRTDGSQAKGNKEV